MIIPILIFFSFIFFPISFSNQEWVRAIECSSGHLLEILGTTRVNLEQKNTLMEADSAPVKGIYSLMKQMEPVNPSVLKLSSVEGVSIRVPWSSIEPKEGRFDWSYLDNALGEVKKANKKAMLRIVPGVHSPEWLYEKGVASIQFKDTNLYHKTYANVVRMPVPWDETYIREWIKFVDMLGRRYSSNGAVVLIHMAGPARAAEMHLPKKGEGRTLTEKAGYSKDRIVSAWKKVIDAYSDAFPGKALALNIAIPFRNDGAMEEVIQYGILRIGKRLCIQGNWLSAHTSDFYHPYKVMVDLQKSVNIGFQMLGGSDFKSTQQGALDAAVGKGLSAGARYFEIYQSDLIEPRNGQFLEGINKRLLANQEQLK